MKKRKFRIPIVWFIIFTALFVFVFTATLILTQNALIYNTVNSVLGGERRVLKSGDPSQYMYYGGDYSDKESVLEAANALNERIVEEGAVLLKNEDGTLPLERDETRITVFGKNSVNPVLGGSGSNAGSSGSTKLDVSAVLDGSGFTCNPVMRQYLLGGNSGSGRPNSPDMGDILTGFPVGEAPLPYSQAVTDSYAQYNDAAIVFISRIGGEGYDLPRSMRYNGSKYTDQSGTTPIPGARSASDHYLQLDANETAMIKEACAHFEKVIVVINSASPVELGFLDDPAHYAYDKNIKAALWIGDPGESGLNALGRILKGDVNPSGRLVDTYARDFKNDPTWYNFGNGLISEGNRYMTEKDGKKTARKLAFVEYREGIYFGYRYYETMAAVCGDPTWYKNNVVYPFGYGLSYTEFTHSVVPKTANGTAMGKSDTLVFDVDVTNVGGYDGKEVVSLYCTPPYKNGGIEKPHIVLADFAKTELLPSRTGNGKLTLSVNVRDLASYDYDDKNGNGFKGYELEAGEYTFYIGNDAHCWADENTPEFTYTVPEGGFRYETDSATGDPVVNLFDDTSEHIREYLSRADAFKNYDCLNGATDEGYRTVDEAFINSVIKIAKDTPDDPWYSDVTPDQSKSILSDDEAPVKLYELIGKKYDDPLWTTLMNSLTVGQMVDLIRSGNFHSCYVESIDKPLTIDADGPMGFALFMGADSIYDTCYYASECVLAAPRNKALAHEFGNMIGNESIVGNERGDGTPYSGWYAPAMNLHRSQFGGRNFEYYSEDGTLSGLIGAEVVAGASEKGVYTFIKHFALNEQETDRDNNGLVTWANEQSMRESYFRPFEMSIKLGGSTAVMSSFNRIGKVWAGGNYALLTSLLRDEWGFEGMVITDFNVNSYMNADQMIRAGGDLNLIGDKPPTGVTTATDVTAIRRAAKNILFTVCGSNAMNGRGAGVKWGYAIPDWVIWVIVAAVGTFFAAVGIGLFTFLPYKPKKPESHPALEYAAEQDKLKAESGGESKDRADDADPERNQNKQ